MTYVSTLENKHVYVLICVQANSVECITREMLVEGIRKKLSFKRANFKVVCALERKVLNFLGEVGQFLEQLGDIVIGANQGYIFGGNQDLQDYLFVLSKPECSGMIQVIL